MKTMIRCGRITTRTALRGVLFCGLVAFCGGCHSVKITEPSRTVSEQLLLSYSADRAIAELNLSPLAGKKVYLEERYFESYDKGYALGAIRQRLSESGARLTTYLTNADIIMEARSGGLGMNMRESLLGIPALGLPVPLAGTITTPELALYKSQKADSIARFALFAYERDSGEHRFSTGPKLGEAYFYHYKFLGFFNWRKTDVRELQKKAKSSRHQSK